VPDQVDHARLHDRVRVDGLDRLREALQPVDAADEDVGDAALLASGRNRSASQAADAHRAIEARETFGKVILRP
jgi:hypothetical protein